jgi:hypothetical protein
MAVDIKLPEDVLDCYVLDEFGGVVVFTPKASLAWRKGKGWVDYPYGIDILNGKDASDVYPISKEQALARIKEIEKYGFEYRSKMANYVVSSDFDDIGVNK